MIVYKHNYKYKNTYKQKFSQLASYTHRHKYTHTFQGDKYECRWAGHIIEVTMKTTGNNVSMLS